MSAEPAYRAVLDPSVKVGTDAWLDTHIAALRKLRGSFGRAPAKALLVFRQPDTFATSIYKERVAIWHGRGPMPDLPTSVRGSIDYFHYPRQITAFEAAFDALDTMSYETACAKPGGLVGEFYNWLGVAEPEAKHARLRESLSNLGVRWLQRCSAEPSVGDYQMRVIFAMHSGADCFREESRSTLWPSDAAFASFVETIRATYDLPFVKTALPPDVPYTEWSDAQHADAERAFSKWAEENAPLLKRRRKAGLRFYRPLSEQK